MKERNSKNDFSNRLNDALLCKNMGHFWNTWRSKFGTSNRSSVVDGCCNEESIADTFASVFQSVGQPNSQVCHEQLKSEFYSLFNNYTSNLSVLSCTGTVDMVDECIKNLKSGKAAWHDDLTVEHVQNSHPLLLVLLSLLFNMIIRHGIVPARQGKARPLLFLLLKIMRVIKRAVIITGALL